MSVACPPAARWSCHTLRSLGGITGDANLPRNMASGFQKLKPRPVFNFLAVGLEPGAFASRVLGPTELAALALPGGTQKPITGEQT
jgi:hypothetical protein